MDWCYMILEKYQASFYYIPDTKIVKARLKTPYSKLILM
jgi:hypothetical protein